MQKVQNITNVWRVERRLVVKARFRMYYALELDGGSKIICFMIC